jgi:hypothetical protein
MHTKGDKMAEKKQEDTIKPVGFLLSIYKLLDEWGVFIRGILRPHVIIPLTFTIVALYCANTDGINKNLSLVLQIIATVVGGVAISFFYDIIRDALEGNLLIKKGLSAVRNLSLARLKIKNISYREKTGASSEETVNLLSLLEKDIANAVQEWNDILPGVGAIEEVYNLLAEKETDLQLAKEDKVQLEGHLKDQKVVGENEKGQLKEKLTKKEQRIAELESQIIKLRTKTDSVPFTGSGLGYSTVPGSSMSSFSPSSMYVKVCSKCGKTYDPSPWFIHDIGLCNDCKNWVK